MTCSQTYNSLPVLLKVSPEGWSESRNSLFICVVNAISNESTKSVHKAVTVDQLYSLVQPSFISPLLFASNLLMYSVTCSKLALTVCDKLHPADNECTASSLWRHSYSIDNDQVFLKKWTVRKDGHRMEYLICLINVNVIELKVD